MKNFLKASLSIAALFSSSAFSSGFPFYTDTCLSPYIGADIAMRYSPFQRNFGGNVFKQYYPEGNLFLGVKVSNYLGAELGYKSSMSKTRVVSLGAGEIILGTSLENPPEVYKSKANFKAWHIKLLGFIPLCKQDCLSLLGSIGISRSKLFAKEQLVQNFIPGLGPSGLTDGQSTSTFSKTKSILTFGTGVQLAVDERTYLRTKIEWEDTSRFKDIIAKENTKILKSKNSFIYSMGILFSF